MRIEVTGKNIAVTDAIRAYAEQKAGKLLKHLDLTQLVTVVVEQRKNDFSAEVVVDVEKHPDFVATAQAGDLYACIDLAVDKASRQVTDFKERLKEGRHTA